MIVSYNAERELNRMPMIRLETVENHRMYCLMPSDNFIVKTGTQTGIEPTSEWPGSFSNTDIPHTLLQVFPQWKC